MQQLKKPDKQKRVVTTSGFGRNKGSLSYPSHGLRMEVLFHLSGYMNSQNYRYWVTKTYNNDAN